MKIGEEIHIILRDKILQEEDFQMDVEADLLSTGVLNSMALIRLVAAIESKFNIKIPPTDLVIDNFLNIQAIQTYITNRLQN